MDEAEAIARADRLWESGRRAAALESLRTRVRREPADAHARRALVARYRELGAADQAGRYGLAIGGLTTPRERRLAARQLAAAGTGAAGLRAHLALPAGDLPPEVLDLVVEVERLRDERRLAWGADHPHAADIGADDVSFAFWAATGTLLAISLLAAVVVDLAGAPWTALARWIAAALVAVMLAGSVLERRRAVRRGRAADAADWATAIVVLALGLVCLVPAAAVVS